MYTNSLKQHIHIHTHIFYIPSDTLFPQSKHDIEIFQNIANIRWSYLSLVQVMFLNRSKC
jgi:hypothetical protein